MARFFTADLHFGHANIIRYCHRPFTDVTDMDRSLIERWNNAVTGDDEIWVLGDLCMGQISESLPLVGLLRGRKVLVAGNHDRCWEGNGRAAVERRTSQYLEAGIDEIRQGTVRTQLGATSVLAGHFPYAGDSHDSDRFQQHRPVDDGHTWLLHGHVHEKWQIHQHQINVGVDVWDYQPVAEERLAALVSEV